MTAMARKVALESLDKLLITAHLDQSLRIDNIGLAQYGENPAQGRSISRNGAPMAYSELPISLYGNLVEHFYTNVVPFQPHAEVAPPTGRRVPLSQEACNERIEMNDKKTSMVRGKPAREDGAHAVSFAAECRRRHLTMPSPTPRNAGESPNRRRDAA